MTNPLAQEQDLEKFARAQIEESFVEDRNGDTLHFVYNITLPLLHHSNEDPLYCHETSAETAQVGKHISQHMHIFFQQLKDFHSGLDPASLGDVKACHIHITIGPQEFSGDRPYCPHRQYHSRRVHLPDTDSLPELPFVTGFSFSSQVGDGAHRSRDVRPISLLVPFQLLSRLPGVNTLDLPWMWERPLLASFSNKAAQDDLTRPWEGPLRDARHEFGAALLSALTPPDSGNATDGLPAIKDKISIIPTLRRAKLYFWRPRTWRDEDQSLPRPDLVSPAADDPVSVAVCKLAVQLEALDLRALLTPAVFPPGGAGTQWPRMQRVRVEFHPLAPDGTWYFVRPPITGDDDGNGGGGNNGVGEDEQGFTIEAEHYPRSVIDEDDQFDIDEDDLDLHEAYQSGTGAGNDEDCTWNLFRTEPCREKIEPLLAAFARSLHRDTMPALRDAELFTWLWCSPRDENVDSDNADDGEDGAYSDDDDADEEIAWRWGVRYVAAVPSIEGFEEPVVQWQVGEWSPSQHIMDLFDNLGVRHDWLDVEKHSERPSWTIDWRLMTPDDVIV